MIIIFTFKDDLVKEYSDFKKANPGNFSWWSYMNMKSDLQTALAFAKFFYPEFIEVDNCLILKDRYSPELYHQWRTREDDKTIIEKMMNLYELKDFFHINRNEDEDELNQLKEFGYVLKHFWTQCLKERYLEKQMVVKVFEEYDDLFITVYEVLQPE